MNSWKFDLYEKEKACYIFGAGSFFGLKTLPQERDYVIAADGGMEHLRALSLTPDLLLGDFDSYPPELLERERREGKEDFRQLSVIKDLSDSAAAIRIGRELGYRRFFLYGCTGGRLDHTMATLQDMAALSMEGIAAFLFSEREIITAVTDCRLYFPEGISGMVSVFSHSDESLGVEESGLKYTVADRRLTNRFPLGLSNEFTKLPASIAVRQGTLLVFVEDRFPAVSVEG